MERKTINISGHMIGYYESGHSAKETIVMIHGLAGTGASFIELGNILAKDYHIIAFDNPGHGRTDAFNHEDDYLFSNIASWYDDNVFERLVGKPFFILGHSWGADIVLHYAKGYPSQIKGVILFDGGFTFPEFQEDMSFEKAYNGWSDFMDQSSHETLEQVIAEYKLYTKRWDVQLEEMALSNFVKHEQYELISSKFTILSIIKAFFKEPFSTTYPHIKAPLFLLYASEPKELDEARNKGIQQLNCTIDNVTTVQLHDTGHMVHWDEPELVANHINEWIKIKG